VTRRPRIDDEGNGFEKRSWKVMRNYFPLYESFWALISVPLRSAGGTHIRAGVDRGLGKIAICHYSCYVNLWRAYLKAQDADNHRFFHEIYLNLSAACEQAMRVVKYFCRLCGDCGVTVPDCAVDAMKTCWDDELKPYRNGVHDSLLAYRKDKRERLWVPVKSKLPKGDRERHPRPLWSETYNFSDDEFVPFEEEFERDFGKLCCQIGQCWDAMLTATKKLVQTSEYQKRIQSGKDQVIHPLGKD
jgi:hypothetical protein